MVFRILALGDVVGKPGRQAVCELLPGLVREREVHFVVCNGENVAGGSGITANLFHKLRSYGVDVVTLGDHTYKRAEIAETLSGSERIIRPANFSKASPGKGLVVVECSREPFAGLRVAVGQVIGRIFVNLPAGDPFEAADAELARVPESVKIRVFDAHCEATSEKLAVGHWLDGRVSLVFGTHTHTPTADAKILPGGTAFISDVGMCGPYDSILGRRKDSVLKHMTTLMPFPFDVATGDTKLCGVLAEIDPNTGRASHIERVELPLAKVDGAYDADDRPSRK